MSAPDWTDHLTRIQFELTRIADALERIADADGVASIPVVQPTLTKPPLAWFDAGNGCAVAVEDTHGASSVAIDTSSATTTAQATWEWLGITGKTHGGRRVRSGRPHNRPGHCGRCGREGRRRLNNADHCLECKDEDWWDE